MGRTPQIDGEARADENPHHRNVGFGDALGDPSYRIDYASLFDFPPVSIRAYSPATVIAEKFQALVVLGATNSRLKDYYDLYTIPGTIALDTDELARTVKATFDRRRTEIPASLPDGLSTEFANSPSK